MNIEEIKQRRRPSEIEAWVNIKGVAVPLTLYGNIKEEKQCCQHIVEIEEAKYTISDELLLIRKGPSEAEFERALRAMRGYEDEIDRR